MTEALEFFQKNEGIIVTSEQKDVIKNNGKIINVVPAHEFLY